jgi:flagellar motility protein MotE (MotC chaperone)
VDIDCRANENTAIDQITKKQKHTLKQAHTCVDMDKAIKVLEVKLELEIKVSCGVRDKIREYHLSLSSMDVVKGD